MQQPPQRLGLDLVRDLLAPLLVLVDQSVRFVEDPGLFIQLPSSPQPNLDRPLIVLSQRQQFAQRGAAEPVQSQRPEHGWAARQQIASRRQLVVLIAAPVVQIVQDLEGHAQVPGKRLDRLRVLVHGARQTGAGKQCRFERRGRLQCIDLQRVDRLQTLVPRIPPKQFGTLALGQSRVRLGQTIQDVSRHFGAQRARLAAHQPIAHPDQVIAHIDRRRRTVLAVHRRFAVPEQIVVLDVVVNQRRLVERLDRHRRPFHGVRKPSDAVGTVRRCRVAAGQGIVDRQGDERPRVLAALRKKIVSDRLGAGDRFKPRDPLAVDLVQPGASADPRHKTFHLIDREHPRRATHQMDVAAGLGTAVGMNRVNHVVYPVLVNRRIPAIAGQQWHGQARNARQQDLVDRFLQDIQAGNSHNRVHVPADNDLQDEGRALGDQDFVTHRFRGSPEVRDAASPALHAVQPVLVVVGRTPLRVFQTVRQQKQTPRRWDG